MPHSTYGSFFPLPGLTPLAPLRDFPLAVITGKSGRQLSRAVTEAIQLSIPTDTTVRVEEIFDAGTAGDPSVDKSNWKLVLSDVRQTQSETPARELSDKQLSVSEERAPTDTYSLTHTLDQSALLAQIASLQAQLQQVQAEKTILQAQVAERSSSSTSVNNQLQILQADIQGLKSVVVPKLNSLQESQNQSSSTVLDCFNQVNSLETRIVNLEEDLVEDQIHVQCITV